MAATKTQMSDLHAILAESLKEQIEGREAAPAVLNVARQFLKDSNIEVDSDNKPAGIVELEAAFDEFHQEDLPDFTN